MKRTKKTDIIILLCLILIFLGALNSIITYISVALVIVLGVMYGEKNYHNPSVNCCKGIILLLVLQNTMIGIGAHLTSNTSSSLSLLTQIPFIAIVTIWLPIGIGRKHVSLEDKKQDKFFLMLLAMIVLSIINGIGSIQAVLITIRNLTVFFMLFQIGNYCIITEKDRNIFTKFLILVGTVILVVGIIIYFGGYKLYVSIGLKEVYIAKGAPITGNGYSGRFTTTLLKTEFVRMGSLIYEPVNLGYIYAGIFIITWFRNWTHNFGKKVFWTIMMGIGLVLSFGKGGYLISLLSFEYVYIQRFLQKLSKRIGRKRTREISIVLLLLFGVAFSVYYYIEIGAATRIHFWGIQQTWNSILRRPYGYGIGKGGNAADTYGSLSGAWLASGGETGLLSYIYQIGFQGGLVFIICVVNTMLPPKTKLIKGDEVFVALPFILLGLSVLQDNTFTPQCIAVFMLLQGGTYGIYKRISGQVEKR